MNGRTVRLFVFVAIVLIAINTAIGACVWEWR